MKPNRATITPFTAGSVQGLARTRMKSSGRHKVRAEISRGAEVERDFSPAARRAAAARGEIPTRRLAGSGPAERTRTRASSTIFVAESPHVVRIRTGAGNAPALWEGNQ
ncbi:MAG TPA: hypothetical protein VED83_01065 [Burkholderiaceae bacterium]|nr:hypothetical protein [Burkholderiaceae bacterium]